MKVQSGSKESILIPVQEILNGAVIDTTTFPVEIAFTADTATPQPGDWLAATWETNQFSGEHDATIIIGPGGSITLAAGPWRPWVRVHSPTETPVLKCPGLVRQQ